MSVNNVDDELKIVAYLDLLGFSKFNEENVYDASSIIREYGYILRTRIANQNNILTQTSASSFDFFLPFSDSIFIASKEKKDFVQQIAHFVLSCFVYKIDSYRNDLSIERPYEVRTENFFGKELIYNNYPILFRGGISAGPIISQKLDCLQNKVTSQVPVLCGKTVVNAVKLEKACKGPRLILDKECCAVLDYQDLFIQPISEKSDCYEVLWPAYHYIAQNGDSEIAKFVELIEPAIKFWKAFNHTEYGIHYFNLIKIIIEGTMAFARKIKAAKYAEEYIINEMERFNLKDKATFILESCKKHK